MYCPPDEFLVRVATADTPVRDVMTTPDYAYARKIALRRLTATGADRYGQPGYASVAFGERIVFEARRTNVREDPLDKDKPPEKRKQIWDVEVIKEILP